LTFYFGLSFGLWGIDVLVSGHPWLLFCIRFLSMIDGEGEATVEESRETIFLISNGAYLFS
jgi:hypothetical protein